MMRLGTFSLLTALLWVFGSPTRAQAQTTNEALDFKEIYDLVRQHAAGLNEADLNRAAAQGLVLALSPRVALFTNGAPTAEAPARNALVIKSNWFEGDLAYIRIGRVADGLSQVIRDAAEHVGSSNKMKGVVLDLRFAEGDDYAAAASVADLFLQKDQVLLSWGDGSARATEKKDAITVPVAVLVNRKTAGAAEALAAILRQTGRGLILGGTTAGQAMIAQEFPLRNGARLRIATGSIRLGDGSLLSTTGLRPDIPVEVNNDDERTYYADAFKAPSKPELLANANLSLTNQPSGTNRAARRPRFNEAELVRERREGVAFDLNPSTDKDVEVEKPVVQDPALARALDLLKGLAVVRHASS
jgi:hypothetical protein